MSDLVHPYITKENYNKVMILSKVSLGKVSFDKALTIVLEKIRNSNGKMVNATGISDTKSESCDLRNEK